MANDLFDLFRDKLKVDLDLVATDPHTLDSLSLNSEEQELILDRVSNLENVDLKIDYSDFSNFVFFNSAYDYFNITGEKILNEYPLDGTWDQVQRFVLDLDPYQRHVVRSWPKSVGHLRFNPTISASFITIEDIGTESGVSKNGLLSPGTGSLTVEVWFEPSVALTGTDDFQMLVQKISGSGASTRYGYSLYLTGSNVTFLIESGSVVNSVSAPFTPNTIQYVAGVYSRGSFTGSLSILTGSQTEFPVVVSSASLGVYDALDIPDTHLYIGSGTLELPSVTAGVNVWYTGSLDDVRIWSEARTLSSISSSFNAKQYAQKKLLALYRFNESGSAFEKEDNSIVIDHSGHSLNGRISNYYSGLRHSGTFLVKEDPDLILNLNTSDISEYVTEQQTSGSAYDRMNQHRITNLLPENFFKLEQVQFGDVDVLQNFLYVTARHFDIIKTYIDQFTHILTQNYGDFNQTPDELLDIVAKFFGWEFTGNFLNADSFQYLLGRSVLNNVQANEELDMKLFEIKNAFWKRLLLNLSHIYKTKGTRESIKSLLRVYGVNDNFVRLKEFGQTPNVGIETVRVNAQKSVYAFGFGSGSLTGALLSSFGAAPAGHLTGSYTAEGRFRFPLTSSADIPATKLSGTLMFVTSVEALASGSALTYTKDSVSSHTGTLSLTSHDGFVLEITGAGIFNNEWYNIAVVNDHVSSSVKIVVNHLDGDRIDYSVTASAPISGALFADQWAQFSVGEYQGRWLGTGHRAEYWLQEVRWWTDVMTDTELADHTLNFQSYGNDANVIGGNDDLILHWRLNENITGSTGLNQFEIVQFSQNPIDTGLPIATDFGVGVNPYKKFLNDYNYISSMDFNWSTTKERIYNTSLLKKSETVNDLKIVSLEFNMIDALNEDIVQMLSSLDELNDVIGFPSNKYRVQYEDLETMRDFYFKRLQGRLNFTVFANMLDFFDRSFIDMVRKLIPGRAYFIGDEFVVESHMLERPKLTYERRKNQEVEFVIEGRIEAWTRFGRNADGSGAKFPLLIGGGS